MKEEDLGKPAVVTVITHYDIASSIDGEFVTITVQRDGTPLTIGFPTDKVEGLTVRLRSWAEACKQLRSRAEN